MTVQVQRFPSKIPSIVLGGLDEAKLDFLALPLPSCPTETEDLPPYRPERWRLS